MFNMRDHVEFNNFDNPHILKAIETRLGIVWSTIQVFFLLHEKSSKLECDGGSFGKNKQMKKVFSVAVAVAVASEVMLKYNFIIFG